MSSVLTRERTSSSSSFPMPLTAPNVEAAWDFLSTMVPATLFSSGKGRRRGERPRPAGQRSDQGYLVFYRRPSLDGDPQLTPLKAPSSILGYLQDQLNASLADHWVCTQVTQFRARRDGQVLNAGFTAGTTRHILGITIDLDGSRMDAEYLELLHSDWWAYRALLEERLDDLGVAMYLAVHSGPDGVHIHIPLIRPDGRPLRATEENLARWERAARGICRRFEDMGADPNAVRPTQPFALPGLPRLKHGGFVPYVAAWRSGARADLIALLRRLSALRLMPAERPRLQLAEPGPQDIAGLLHEVAERAAGLSAGTGQTVDVLPCGMT